jgi:hypothetical protein
VESWLLVFQQLKEPKTQPISQEQLEAEVKGLYAGLVMVESKCIEVDNQQSLQNDACSSCLFQETSQTHCVCD